MMTQIYLTKKKTMTMVYLLVAMMSFTAYSQNPVYSTIAKNIHPDGKSLHHDLNATGDTLHLKSDYNLYKVEFISKTENKVFMIEGAKSEAYIPLASVPVGEYTIAGFQIERSDDIYQYQKTIIFRVSRLLPIPIPINEDDEEMIAEVTSDNIDDIPFIEEDTELALVEKLEPSKKKKLKTQTKPKEKVAKRVPKAKKNSEIASNSESRPKTFEESRQLTKERKLAKKKSDKKSRITETKEPRMDTTEYKTYNLSTQRGGRYVVQSRSEYRRLNLRPNGKPYR